MLNMYHPVNAYVALTGAVKILLCIQNIIQKRCQAENCLSSRQYTEQLLCTRRNGRLKVLINASGGAYCRNGRVAKTSGHRRHYNLWTAETERYVCRSYSVRFARYYNVKIYNIMCIQYYIYRQVHYTTVCTIVARERVKTL